MSDVARALRKLRRQIAIIVEAWTASHSLRAAFLPCFVPLLSAEESERDTMCADLYRWEEDQLSLLWYSFTLAYTTLARTCRDSTCNTSFYQ